MAHAATLSSLAESLVTATTGKTTTDPALRKLRDQTLRGLKDQSHARTNQFAVKDSYNGLVEKFVVLNRDDLADALEERLEELPTKSKWMPEILSLLLELTDRPAEKTQLEDVLNVNKPTVAEPELTWNEIIADDPFDEPDIWDEIERGYHSSGDDEFEHDVDSEPTVSTKATSLQEDDSAAMVRLHLIQPDEAVLDGIKSTRKFWRSAMQQEHELEPSELSLVREMLSMLHGLPTDLFELDEASGEVNIPIQVRLSNTSHSTVLTLLESSADLGTRLNFLRLWMPVEQQISYLESMLVAVEKLLTAFGRNLSSIEQQLIRPIEDHVASANQVLSQIIGATGPLAHLSKVIQRSSNASEDQNPFALLDLLYEETNVAQMVNDQSAFEVLADALLAGLETYLRPITAWIRTGSLTDRDQDVFFIKELDRNIDPGNLWRSQFEILANGNGGASVPVCILPFADKIFALGKSKSFLKRLDQQDHDSEEGQVSFAEGPAFESVRRSILEETLIPFSQLLNDTLQDHISKMGKKDTTSLASRLMHEYGLKIALAALPYVFLSKDGLMFQSFADTVFDLVTKRGQAGLQSDQFLLTELAQTTLGDPHEVPEDCLYISFAEEDASIARSNVHRLGFLKLEYRFSWPVQNIAQSKNPDTLSKAFTLLLQTSYSINKLSVRFFDLRSENTVDGAVLALRQRLLRFANILRDHITTTTNTVHEEMQKQIVLAVDIDSMVVIWEAYEKRLQTTLLLLPNLAPVREAVISILELTDALSNTSGSRGVAHINGLLEKHLTFLIAGIRSVSRAGGEPALEVLAERLDWSAG